MTIIKGPGLVPESAANHVFPVTLPAYEGEQVVLTGAAQTVPNVSADMAVRVVNPNRSLPLFVRADGVAADNAGGSRAVLPSQAAVFIVTGSLSVLGAAGSAIYVERLDTA